MNTVAALASATERLRHSLGELQRCLPAYTDAAVDSNQLMAIGDWMGDVKRAVADVEEAARTLAARPRVRFAPRRRTWPRVKTSRLRPLRRR